MSLPFRNVKKNVKVYEKTEKIHAFQQKQAKDRLLNVGKEKKEVGNK